MTQDKLSEDRRTLKPVPEGVALTPVEWDMLSHGDMLGSALGKKVADLLALRSATPMPEPYLWVYESPGHFDPVNGGEPPYTDFSDEPKPGYVPLYTTPPAREISEAEVERAARAIDALWSEGQDRGPAFEDTEREYQAHCRSTARAALEAARSPS
jgi:hypothetical protein